MSLIRFVVAATLVALGAQAWGEDRHGQLDNGLQYIIRQTSRPIGEVEFRLVVKAGEIDVDDAKLQGAMHLIEHMAFRNTKAYPAGSLIPFLRSKGFRFGQHLNGQTTPGNTTYRLSLPHAQQQGVAQGLEVLFNMAQGIEFDSALLTQEERVVAEEIRGRQNNPWTEVWQTGVNLPLAETGVGAWSYGTPDSINAMQASDLAALYQRLYRANRMTIIVSGDVDVAQTESMLRKQFASVAGDDTAKTAFQRGPWPLVEHLAYAVNTVPDKSGNYLGISFALPRNDFHTREGNQQSYQYSLLRQILKARLRGELLNLEWQYRDDGQPYFALAYRVYPDIGKFKDHRPDHFNTLEMLENNLATLIAEPLDEATLAQFKQEYLGSVQQWYANGRNRATTEADLLQSAAQGTHPWSNSEAEWPQVQAAVAAVDSQKITEMLRAMQQGPRYVQLAQEWPLIKYIPNRDEISKWYRDFVPVVQSAQYPDRSLLTLPEPQFAAGQTIAQNKVGDFNELKLSNGLRVLIHTMPQANGLLAFRMDAPGGIYQFKEDQFAAAIYANAAVSGAAVAMIPSYEMERTRQSLGLSFTAFVENEFHGFRGITPLSGLDAAFAEIHHRFLRKETRDILGNYQAIKEEDQFNDYNGLINNEIRPAAFGGDYRTKVLDKRWIGDNRSSSDLVYRQLFGDPAQFTLLIAGPATVAQVKPLLEKWLANIPRRADTNAVEVAAFAPQAGGEVQITDNKLKTAQVRIEFNSLVSDYSHQKAAQMRLLHAVLEERLRQSLREVEGESYAPWADWRLIPSPAHLANITLGFDVAPAHEEKALALSKQIIAQLREQAVTDNELKTAKQIVSRELTSELNEPESLLWRAAILNMGGQTLAELDRTRTVVNEMDSKTLQEGAAQLLAEQWMTVGRLTPNPRM